MNEKQRDFLEHARESVDAARLLLEGGHPGFAASRAYYTMFYLASTFLEGRGLRFSSHAAVIGAFGREFAKTGALPREFHRFLRRAEDLRRIGDYIPFQKVTVQQAQEQIDRAEQFLKLAEEQIK